MVEGVLEFNYVFMHSFVFSDWLIVALTFVFSCIGIWFVLRKMNRIYPIENFIITKEKILLNGLLDTIRQRNKFLFKVNIIIVIILPLFAWT